MAFRTFLKLGAVAGALLAATAAVAAETVTLQSVVSGQYVRAGVGRESYLAATSPRAYRNGWESFRLVKLGGDKVALQSLLSGRYVRAGVTRKTYLAASSTRIANNGWEAFRLIQLGGDKVALKSVVNGKFVRAGVGANSRLAAVSPKAYANGWEAFRLRPDNTGAVTRKPVSVSVETMTLTGKTTDVSDRTFLGLGSNTRDEIYLVVSGAHTSRSGTQAIDLGRISPRGKQNYYQFERPKRLEKRNIGLFQGRMEAGDMVTLNVLVREQDNAQLKGLERLAKASGAALAGALGSVLGIDGSQALLEVAKREGTKAGEALVKSLGRDGDETVGAFTVVLHMDKGRLKVAWEALDDTRLTRKSDRTKRSRGTFAANGNNSGYTLQVLAEAPTL